MSQYTKQRIFVFDRVSGLTWTLNLALLGLFLSGCATSNTRPGWLTGDLPDEYSKKQFLSAVGTGDGFESAEIAAKRELSQIISTELRSEIELIDQESVVDGESVTTSDFLMSTNLSTSAELQGVEVPLHWRDGKTGEVWAFAVLDRGRECLRIREEGEDLGTRLDARVLDAEGGSNALVEIRTLGHAVELGEKLDVLQARSRVVGSQCLRARSISTGALRARLDRALQRLSFVVTAREFDARTGASVGPLPQLRERIAENLTAMGFQVGPARDAQVIAVTARLRVGRVRRGTEWIEYRWEGSAEMASPSPDSSAIISTEGDGAESHPEATTARLRARRKGELALSRQLDERLKAFLAE